MTKRIFFGVFAADIVGKLFGRAKIGRWGELLSVMRQIVLKTSWPLLLTLSTVATKAALP
jgi:hypothetical protein